MSNPKITFISEKAKADFKAKVKKSLKTADTNSTGQPINTPAAIKGFCRQYPKAASLFGKIIGKWRGSTARCPGKEGFWAAYPYREWLPYADFQSESTLKRHLDILEEAGLIQRECHKHGGSRVLAFIRPSPNGLSLSSPRPTDWTHLGTTQADFLNPAPTHKPLTETYVISKHPSQKQTDEAQYPKSKDELLAILQKPLKQASD
jgi:hypothetical protein